MADIRTSSFGGIPSGDTDDRPSSPVIGDTYYNGQIEALEIYNGTNWKVIKSEGFPPDAPTITSVTDSSSSTAYSSTAGTLDVVFVPAGTGGTATQYNAFTTTGGHSGFTTVGDTVTITGLTPGTAYTVYGNAQNGSGISTNTANASPVTPTTLPQAPTIGTATASGSANEIAVTWTLGSNGGKTLSAITITPYLNGTTAGTSRTAATTSSTSYTFTDGQLTSNSAYTFKVKTTNANGDSPESSASNSATMPSFVIVNYLVIAGGGGGGKDFGGAGGAGGYRTSAGTSGGNLSALDPLTLSTSTNYTVTVGAGGAGSNTTSSRGAGGANSVFSTITSIGGGGGGSRNNSSSSGGTGGSGGGGGYNNGSPGAGGARTASPVQGHDGGASNPYVGGGGGAGGAGANESAGVGLASTITGSSVTRGAGGSGSSPTANTGGGGAWSGSGPDGGPGAAGIVILRYPSTKTITVGAGLTANATGTDGSFSYKVFTAGSGNVSWA
jgi:hypothetical protein